MYEDLTRTHYTLFFRIEHIVRETRYFEIIFSDRKTLREELEKMFRDSSPTHFKFMEHFKFIFEPKPWLYGVTLTLGKNGEEPAMPDYVAAEICSMLQERQQDFYYVTDFKTHQHSCANFFTAQQSVALEEILAKNRHYFVKNKKNLLMMMLTGTVGYYFTQSKILGSLASIGGEIGSRSHHALKEKRRAKFNNPSDIDAISDPIAQEALLCGFDSSWKNILTSFSHAARAKPNFYYAGLHIRETVNKPYAEKIKRLRR